MRLDPDAAEDQPEYRREAQTWLHPSLAPRRGPDNFSSSHRMPQLLLNLGWGIYWGLSFAAGAALLASASYLIVGPERLTAKYAPLDTVLLSYLWGGVTGGIVVGLLRGSTRSWWGAAVVGLIVAIPVGVGIGVTMFGESGWERYELLGAITAVLTGGPMGGVIVWRQSRLLDR